MHRTGLCRWLSATALVCATVAGPAAVGHAQPPADGDGDISSIIEPRPHQLYGGTDPLPPPSNDLVGEKPIADTLAPSPVSPYPDPAFFLSFFESRPAEEFFTASNEGVWFTTPLGLNCGIWDRGSFGCTGDIRGAPPGTTHIGWVNGNIVTRYNAFDPLLPFQFPPGRPERLLPPRSYVDYNGTRCVTMTDGSTYCARGPFRFFVTPTATILSPP